MGRERNDGFTLVEVLVALMVLGVALMSLWGFHWTSRQVNVSTKREAAALALANQRLEELRRQVASGKWADNCTEDAPCLDNCGQYFLHTQGNIWCERTTVADPDPVNGWRRNVTVSVRWREQRGGQGQVSLQTILVQ
uniref:Type II secretion system protein n=1 Tax=Desulfacinum infernum TaxID=35837 RepID=A0A832EA68_9BACT